MSEISRLPWDGETAEEMAANLAARQGMEPDARDLVNVTRSCMEEFGKPWSPEGQVQSERAKRAGTAVRLEAVNRYDLTTWRGLLYALFAALYGTVDPLFGMGRLVCLCCWAKTLGSAKGLVEALECARCEYRVQSQRLGLVAQLAYNALSRMNVVGGMQACDVRRVAAMAGLVVENRERWDKATSQWVPGGNLDLETVLASGFANFNPSATPALLEYWASLANQKGMVVSLPDVLDRSSITAWAKLVCDESCRAEKQDAPDSWIVVDDEEEMSPLLLCWDGKWTKGRSVRVEVVFRLNEEVFDINLCWCTATGHHSNFLDIEELLALPGCRQFRPGRVYSPRCELRN